MPAPFSTPVTTIGTVGRQRSATARVVDNVQVGGPRQWRYSELAVVSMFPDYNALCDEGSFFVANNNQTGIATAAAPTAFSATNPFISIFNSDAVGGVRIFLDDITLIATAAGTAGTSVQVACTIDQGNRFTSGGTPLTPLNSNMDDGTKSVAIINAGNLTCAAATASVRTPVGNRWLKGAIPVAGDEYVMKFAATDSAAYLNLQNSVTKSGVALPPVIIGPQQTFLLHLWLPSQSAASSYIPEINYFER